ncbi:MAG TPA: hypothetical protein PLE45_01090 [Spirochaetota bacterium]|nr:hypothetical protein [Spirochaetota bacterium]HOL56062.1 hypothetical protein [Spirochaetota bacterium]HPP03208.1 hypothetical protein [Spirochaetota bacterium]
MPQVKAICLSDKKGIKIEVDSAIFIENFGIKNDFHAKKDSLRQVSILNYEIFHKKKDELLKNNIQIQYGAFGENLIIDDFDFNSIKIGTRFVFESKVELEVTIIGKDCISPCIIQKKTGNCIMPEYGIFCRVIKGGVLKNGDSCYYC